MGQLTFLNGQTWPTSFWEFKDSSFYTQWKRFFFNLIKSITILLEKLLQGLIWQKTSSIIFFCKKITSTKNWEIADPIAFLFFLSNGQIEKKMCRKYRGMSKCEFNFLLGKSCLFHFFPNLIWVSNSKRHTVTVLRPRLYWQTFPPLKKLLKKK